MHLAEAPLHRSACRWTTERVIERQPVFLLVCVSAPRRLMVSGDGRGGREEKNPHLILASGELLNRGGRPRFFFGYCRLLGVPWYVDVDGYRCGVGTFFLGFSRLLNFFDRTVCLSKSNSLVPFSNVLSLINNKQIIRVPRAISNSSFVL